MTTYLEANGRGNAALISAAEVELTFAQLDLVGGDEVSAIPAYMRNNKLQVARELEDQRDDNEKLSGLKDNLDSGVLTLENLDKDLIFILNESGFFKYNALKAIILHFLDEVSVISELTPAQRIFIQAGMGGRTHLVDVKNMLEGVRLPLNYESALNTFYGLADT